MPAKPRKKPPPQTTSDYLSTLEHTIRQLAYGHHTFTIFRHFVELCAISLSNVADPINKKAREKQYLAIVKQYKPEQFQQFPPMLGMLALCLEHEHTDVLGRLYHRLEIHNDQTGQFFTPYPVCLAMAKVLVHDAKHLVEEQEFIRAQEPCVGSGAMVIALAQALREEGMNYQQCLHVTAIDLDIVAVHMAYVQCTFLHVPAIILHGDTLRGEVYSQWRTFAHTLGFWDAKLARDARQQAAPGPALQPSENPSRAPTEPLIFVRYLEAGVTLLGLAKELLQRGIKSPRGNPRWSAASLHGLLSNPTYTGKLYVDRSRARPARLRRSATHPI